MKFASGVIALTFLTSSAQAGWEVKSAQERDGTYSISVMPTEDKTPKPCDSFKEFKEAYEKILGDGELALNEEKAARLSLRISRGCNGAANRFFKAYEMMKKTGVALVKAVEVGLDFAALDDERLKNFNEVFSKMYLENAFDFDFATAYRVSFELSRDYEGKAQDVREDFIKLVKFCTSNDKAALPLRQCAELALKIVEHTPKFPGGLYSSFEKFYTFLRTDKRMGLSVIDSLNLVPKVFTYGPKAPENFIAAMDYAVYSKKITIDHANAINLALRLAKQSLPQQGKEDFNEVPDKK
ncbi:hypothetical protein [Bdellovibrio sp. HCB337]|uniref:hypothetical protein n=1 Tax=Bdellovibrio sp. HCB337 TaxID=3394358 RepID=UPI0039A4B3F2